ncbi:MAG: rhodanese-like domain-containing protein [candidate division Zixibacteria bacterium]|mgnify:CR=1 FL=1|nr:rhodanese-like domain-containing protein [candidate division Zixibacteria bacterium]
MSDIEAPAVTVLELQRILDSGRKIFLLDVRTAGEFEAGRLPFTDILVPHDVLSARIEEIPKDRETEIYCFCRSGRRSAITTTFLRGLGYEKVFNITGGIIAWKDAGFDLISGPAE